MHQKALWESERGKKDAGTVISHASCAPINISYPLTHKLNTVSSWHRIQKFYGILGLVAANADEGRIQSRNPTLRLTGKKDPFLVCPLQENYPAPPILCIAYFLKKQNKIHTPLEYREHPITLNKLAHYYPHHWTHLQTP